MEDETEVPDVNFTGEENATEEALANKSLLERLISQREETEETLELEIPSWDGAMIATYSVIPRAELNKLLKKSKKIIKANEAAVEPDLDLLARACVKIEAYDAESDTRALVSNGYGEDLAERLGNPEGTGTARLNVLYMFRKNGIAVGAQSLQVSRWMQGLGEDPQ